MSCSRGRAVMREDGSSRGQRRDKGLLFAALALFVGVWRNGGGALERARAGTALV